MDYDILITNGRILTESPDNESCSLIEQGGVAIKNGLIAEVVPMAQLPSLNSSCQIIDAGGNLVMPGLVNGHCHGAMTLFRGLADDLPLMTWLNEHIFPAEAKFVNEEMVYWCSKLAAAEMICSGTTTVSDSYFFEDKAAEAFSEVGIRSVAAQGVIDFPAPGVPDPAKNIDAAQIFVDRWQGKDPLVQPAIFCHSPYTCGPETIQRAKDLARSKNVPFFMHVSETKTEYEQIKEKFGVSPVRHLYELGILDEATTCVHCVWLDDEDIDILASSKAKVVSCPESNMKLAAGIAPVTKILAKGITLGLGTDGCASNNDLDLFREMDTLAKLHKVNSFDPTVLPASKVMKIATFEGGAAAGLTEPVVGKLKVGAAADIVIIDLEQPHFMPFYNSDLLVYAARGSDVRDVVVAGRLVYHDRRLVNFDLQETGAKVVELARSVKSFAR